MKPLPIILCLGLLVSCSTPHSKPYDRTNIARGFTRTEDSLADARKYTQDAKDEVRGIKSNSKLIDNKAGVILRYWDKAK